MISLGDLNELLVAHNSLRHLNIQLSGESLTYDLSLFLSKSEDFESDTVFVKFINVSNFSTHGIGGGLTQLMHLHVSELGAGLDRMHYELTEREDNKLSFSFASFVADL